MKDFTKDIPTYPQPDVHGVEDVKEESVKGGYLVFALVIVLSLSALAYFRYDIGVYAYEKYGIENSWMEEKIEVVEQENLPVKDVPVPTKINELPEIERVSFRLNDGNSCEIHYRLFYKVEPSGPETKAKIRNAIRKYFISISSEELYINVNKYSDELSHIIAEIDQSISSIEYIGILFPRDVQALIDRKRETKYQLEQAKAMAELAKAQAVVTQERHKARMEALEQERAYKLYNAETKALENEILNEKALDKKKSQ